MRRLCPFFFFFFFIYLVCNKTCIGLVLGLNLCRTPPSVLGKFTLIMIDDIVLYCFFIAYPTVVHTCTIIHMHVLNHTVPPDCLLDRSLGSHEYVTANGIKFHYVTAGDRSKPLMLFLHGFPEASPHSNT